MTRSISLSAQSRAVLLLAVAVGGLAYVKWVPYWDKALVAASRHAIGASILTGGAARAPAASLGAGLAYAGAYFKAVWKALVLGLVLGSGVQALIPDRWIARWLGREGASSAFAGAVLSLPGMMCTCCAAPVVGGLRRQSASASGAIAFWLGNSVLNPATLVFIGFVLGWRWAALRFIMGAAMVIGAGLLAGRASPPRAGGAAGIETAAAADAAAPGLFLKWLRILGAMSVRLVPEYAVIVLALGAARAWLFPAAGPHVDNQIGWILAFAAAGAIFVIPTAGEVPILQTFLALGGGVGPAAALLMTLPPVSLPSIAMVWSEFPKRTLLLVFGLVLAIGVAAGGLAVALRF